MCFVASVSHSAQRGIVHPSPGPIARVPLGYFHKRLSNMETDECQLSGHRFVAILNWTHLFNENLGQV